MCFLFFLRALQVDLKSAHFGLEEGKDCDIDFVIDGGCVLDGDEQIDDCPTFVGFGDGDSYFVIEYEIDELNRITRIHPQHTNNNSVLAPGNISRILEDYNGTYVANYSLYKFYAAVTESDDLNQDAEGKLYFEGELQAPSRSDTFWPIRLRVSNYHNNTVGVSVDDVEYAVYENASFLTNSTSYLTMMNQIKDENKDVEGTYITGITVNRECRDPVSVDAAATSRLCGNFLKLLLV